MNSRFISLSLAVAASASAQPCVPSWNGPFAPADLNGDVLSSLSFDDGSGRAIFIGGTFTSAGGQDTGRIARWTASGFQPVGPAPYQIGAPRAMITFDDDGGGPNPTRLYAGTEYTGLLGNAARWTGSAWEALKGLPPNVPVRALVVFDDGTTGNCLYAAGEFPCIYRWTGTTWSKIDAGMGAYPGRSLAVFDEDGAGPGAPALFVGGEHWNTGGGELLGIARWDGTAWSGVGGGFNTGAAWAMAVFDADGSGPGAPNLVVGGDFTSAGGTAASRIARWDGSAWSALGTGITIDPFNTQPVYTMSVVDEDRTGPLAPSLFVGGLFLDAGGASAKNLARWRAGAWSAVGNAPSKRVWTLTVDAPPDEDPWLFVGGEFTPTPGIHAAHLADNSCRPLGGGVIGSVSVLTPLTFGGSERLYIGGTFSAVAGGAIPAGGVASWDGETWDSLGGGVGSAPSVQIRAISTFDVGAGPEVFIGGDLGVGTGIPAQNIAVTDGSSWSAMGPGLGGPVGPTAWFDPDGAGPTAPSLYAGGSFPPPGGGQVSRLARWNGTSWDSVSGSGLFSASSISALLAYDDGSGPALYCGGSFSPTFTSTAPIMRWRPSQGWTTLGALDADGGFVSSLCLFDDGTGTAMYAGGRFASIGGVAANAIAKWNGTTWAPLAGGVFRSGSPAVVASMAVFPTSGGSVLMAGGQFDKANGATGIDVKNIAQWNGGAWSSLADPGGAFGLSGGSRIANALRVHGGVLYVGGSFGTAGSVGAQNTARWDGTNWSTMATGLNNEVFGLEVFDAGSGPFVYAGGRFTSVSGVPTRGLARWTGTTWISAGGLSGGSTQSVSKILATDLGAGPVLIVAGDFTVAGMEGFQNFARWNGAMWKGVLPGPNSTVRAVIVHDEDGAGAGAPALYLGGAFQTIGTLSAARVARWSGSAWSALGSGLNNPVFSLLSFNDGSGAALYVTGSFTDAGGQGLVGIARWRAGQWEGVGGGGATSGSGTCLTVQGASLYLGGTFPGMWNGATPINALNIARWNGSAWSALGAGLSARVEAVVGVPGDPGPGVYAAGDFTASGATPLSHIARWDGSTWLALGSGTLGAVALAEYHDSIGAAVYAGGTLVQAGGVPAQRIARWGCLEESTVVCYPDCNGDAFLNLSDFGCFQTKFAQGDPYADCNGDGVRNLSDFGCFQTKFALGCP